MFLHRGCCCEDRPSGCGSDKPIKVSAVYSTHPDIELVNSNFYASMSRGPSELGQGRGCLDALYDNGDIESVNIINFNPEGDGGGGSVSDINGLKNSCLIFCGFSARYFCQTQLWPNESSTTKEQVRNLAHDLRNISVPTNLNLDEGGNIQNECLAGMVHAVAEKGATLVVLGGSSQDSYTYDVPESPSAGAYSNVVCDISADGVNKINNFLQFLDDYGSQRFASPVAMRIQQNVTFPPDAIGGQLLDFTSQTDPKCQIRIANEDGDIVYQVFFDEVTLGQIISAGTVEIDDYQISVRQEHGGGVILPTEPNAANVPVKIGVDGIGFCKYGQGHIIVASSPRTFKGLLTQSETGDVANGECLCIVRGGPPNLNNYPMPDSPNALYMDSLGPGNETPAGPHWLSAWCKKFVMKGDVGELF